jgi:SulP family sulfate permease
MLATVLITVFSHNLALGVGAGVLLSALFFAHKVATLLDIQSEADTSNQSKTYAIRGQLFFGSADRFVAAFDFQEVLKNVTIDVSQAHFWDLSAVAALDRVVLKFRREGTEVNTVGMNQASQTLVLKLGTHHKNDADSNQALH